jgi:hypothetical protein
LVELEQAALLLALKPGLAGFVRTTLTISACAHGLFWALAALHGPQPLANSPETSIAVEIVSPEELARLGKTDATETSTSEQSEPQSVAKPQHQDNAQQAQQASLAPSERAAPQSAQQVAQAAPASSATLPQLQPGSSWLDSALSPITSNAFESTGVSANLSQTEIAAFKAHLQQCWRAPAAISEAQKLVVVLRVSLKPDGALGAEPTMVAASASENGPALMQTAMRALRQCQPYAFLPAAKYKEWKVLDLSFSPSGLRTAPVL